MKMPNAKVLNTAKNFLMNKTGRIGLKLRKASPEILIVVGVGGVIIGTVMACKATLRVEEVLDDTQSDLDKIHDGREKLSEEKYSQQDYVKDLAITYTKTGVNLIKLYGPSILLMTGSIACIVGSHGIMKRRNVALMAAYKAIQTSYDSYRKNVIDEYGEEKDREYRLGLRETKETVKDEDGKETEVKTLTATDPYKLSQYARFFDESSKYFSKTPEYNKVFLLRLQNQFNDLLHSRGHVFLNEVYDALDIPRSQAGQVVGWIYPNKDDKNYGKVDGYIDFGIFTINSPAARRFVNGQEGSILLDFNVDGVIYDML